MIKKYLVIIYSLLKKILYLNNTRNIKSDTWKSKRVSDKFYNVHNLNQKDFFHKITSKIFLKYIKKDVKILDAGCGTGRLLSFLRSVSKNCYGLDISQNMLDRISPKDNLYCGSAFEMPFEDNFFDIVTSMDLMVHFEETEEILREKLRVLKKGGLIIFNIGSEEHYELSKKIYKENFNPIYENSKNTLHKPYYKTISDEKLTQLGKKNSFTLVKSIPYNFFSSNILMTSSTENNSYPFDKNFKNYFGDEKFASFIEEFETNIINNSNPAMTFYKIIVLKKI